MNKKLSSQTTAGNTSPDDIEEALKLRKYILQRFGSKERFLSFLNEKIDIGVTKSISYPSLLNKLDTVFGRDTWLPIIGIKSVDEAEFRTQLSDALFEGLDLSMAKQFTPLYEKLTGEKIKIKRKHEKRELVRKLALEVSEKDFIKAWVQLAKDEKIPFVIHYKNITVGALGWLKSLAIREKSLTSGYLSEIMDVLYEKFDKKSQEIIIGYLINIVKEIGKDPKRFELPEECGERVAELFKIFNGERDQFTKYSMALQLIYTYLDDDDFINVINVLIGQESIKPPDVRGFYERFPYYFSDVVITPYGLIKQIPKWERDPNKALAELLEKELEREDLEPELQKFHGEYSMQILEYCIRGNPRGILNRMFGVPRLRSIVKEHSGMNADKIKNQDELIDLVILSLGFNLPPKLEGITYYQEFLKQCEKRIMRGEAIRAVMMEVFDELDKVLRDIAYFYICFLWKLDSKPFEERIKKTEELVKEFKVSDKPLSKLSLGERVKVVRILNDRLNKNSVLKENLKREFERDYILNKVQLSILDEVIQYRNQVIVHREDKTSLSQEDSLKNINKLEEFAQSLKRDKIYPLLIRINSEIKNGYGTSYFEAEDEDGSLWTVEQSHLIDTDKPYFMHSKTNPVAIKPLLIEKF